MKKILCAALALVMALCFCGCDKIDKIIDVLNETAAPTEGPTEAPTEEPAAPAFCEKLAFGEDLSYDLDSDGAPETIRIDETPKEYDEFGYNVTVTCGADPEHKYTYELEYCFEFAAWVIDSYADDNRLELLFSYGQDSDDWTTVGVRVSDDGSEFLEYTEWFGVTEELMSDITAEFGFTVDVSTHLFGTRSLLGTMKLGADGFLLTSDGYHFFIYEDGESQKLTLKRDMDVELVDENGASLGAYTVPAGERILPYATDDATYVIVRLDDGRLGRAAFEYHDWETYPDDYGYYINGINQDEYADLLYAD